MNKIAFTICSRSYIGMANVLRNSFLRYNDEYEFFIILADTDEVNYKNCLYAEKILKNYISKEKYEEMSFKYNVTELCTSLKPFVLKYFLEEAYELAVYIDPDICFYSQFKELDNKEKKIFITPHIITMRANYDGDEKEENFLKYGIYNCGFIAFRNSEISLSVLNWWATKLFDYSYADAEWGIYTDQKWIDFLPNFVPQESLCIIRNLGCNVAPWNFYEREIFEKANKYFVKERNGDSSETELIFIHFSGYNYKKLMDNEIKHNHRILNNYKDIPILLLHYGHDLKKSNTENYFKLGYKYNKFQNGDIIFNFHRRLYRGLLMSGEKYNNLFCENADFYNLLKKNRMIIHTGNDVTSKRDIQNLTLKNILLNKFYKFIFSILGVKKFVEFLTALQLYSRFENQVNLLKK